MRADPETELISRCRRGDADAWNELVDLHYAATGRFIFQLAPDFTREETEEICQEVFASVVKNLHMFNRRSRLQTWIFRIAINKARDCRLKQQAVKRGGGRAPVSLQAEDPETGLTLDPPSPLPGPDLELLRSENLSLVGEALEQLGEPGRTVIELRYFGDLSYEEIAAELRLNPKTVSSRLSKSLDRLETILRRLMAQEAPAVVPAC